MKKATESSPRYVRVNDGIATHNSAMHAELHQRLYDLVSEPDKQKLHITEKQLKDWRALIDQELDLNRAQRSSEMTPQLQKLDDERSGLLTQLFATIRNNAHSPINTLSEPGAKLLPLVRSYKGIQKELAEAKSAHVDGLLMDLAKLPTETAALGLNVIIDALRTNNEKLGKLNTQRVMADSKRTISSMKQLRPMTDEAFYEIRSKIEGSYAFATDDADRKLLMELVDAINHMLASYSTTRKSSKVQQNIAKQMALENNHKLIDPQLPELAASAGYTPGDLTFTGHTKTVNKEMRYEVQVVSTGKKLWTRFIGTQLMFVKTKTGARGNGSAKVKPKDRKHPGGSNKPSDGKQPDDGNKPGGGAGSGGGSNPSGNGGNPSGGEGHGSATVTPKT